MRKLSASMFSSNLVKAYQKGKARVELIGSPKTKTAKLKLMISLTPSKE
jgi:hypothetical protein